MDNASARRARIRPDNMLRCSAREQRRARVRGGNRKSDTNTRLSWARANDEESVLRWCACAAGGGCQTHTRDARIRRRDTHTWSTHSATRVPRWLATRAHTSSSRRLAHTHTHEHTTFQLPATMTPNDVILNPFFTQVVAEVETEQRQLSYISMRVCGV